MANPQNSVEISHYQVQRPNANPKECFGKPECWADTEQELSETLPYYRLGKNGVCNNNNFCSGLILGKDFAERLHFGNEVFIIKASSDSQAKYLKVNMEEKIVVALIATKTNIQCQSKLPHNYNVLCHATVTDVWNENSKNIKKACWKIRLEKINQSKKSWWSLKDSLSDEIPKTLSQLSEKKDRAIAFKRCPTCNQESKTIFQCGWMCLQSLCKSFWLINDLPAGENMAYITEFLLPTNTWKLGIPYRLEPELPSTKTLDGLISKEQWTGLVCPNCKRCIQRKYWHGWICKTPGCSWFFQIPRTVVSATSLLTGHAVEFTGHALPTDNWTAEIKCLAPTFLGNWRIHTYQLSKENTISHFFANKATNEENNGPNELFKVLQDENYMPLERCIQKRTNRMLNRLLI